MSLYVNYITNFFPLNKIKMLQAEEDKNKYINLNKKGGSDHFEKA